MVFHRPVTLIQTFAAPANFHFFLIVAPAKWFRLLLGTLDKSVGGVSSAEHQRDAAWAGAAVTVIPSQSPFKGNWCHLQQPHLFVFTLLCFSEIGPQALRAYFCIVRSVPEV